MDTNIAFSSSEAIRLNEYLQTSLSEHLFLTCNYEPKTIFTPISEDAKFITAVNNMYKFLVDAGICNNLYNSFKKEYNNLDRIDRIIKDIRNLRTVFDHNINQLNGNDKVSQSVEEWCHDVLGKKFDNTEEEYKKVLWRVKDYGKESVRILTSFIEYISGLKVNEKRQIIKDWEELIIKFYKRPSSKTILEGQLFMYYRSQVSEVKRGEKIYIVQTVKNMMTYKKNIEDLQFILKRLNEIESSNPSDSFKEQRIKIEKQIKEFEDKKEAIRKAISEKLGRKNDGLTDYDYYNYYLNEKLLKTIENKILNNTSHISLLPQNIILETIKDDFKNVQIKS